MNFAKFLTFFIIFFSFNFDTKAQDVISQDLLNISQKSKQKTNSQDGLSDILSISNDKFKTIMFDNKDIDNIDKAISLFGTGQSLNIKDEQYDDINNKQDLEGDLKLKNEKNLLELNERSKIYLGSIFYFSPRNWAIWLNKDKVTHDENNRKNEFYVEKINGRQASILWTLSLSKWRILSGKSQNETTQYSNDNNQVLVRFTLRPNQTYVLKFDKVFEGKDIKLTKASANQKK